MSFKHHRIALIGVLAASLFLTTGCSSWQGLAPERYGTVKIKRDKEAIHAFAERQEITGNIKELYLNESYSEELLLPSLEHEDREEDSLPAAVYEIGNRILPGRYVVSVSGTGDSRGTVRLEDSKGKLIADEYLDEFMGVPFLHLDLREGNRLSVSGGGESGFYLSSTGEMPDYFDLRGYLADIGSIQKAEENQLVLETGLWEVGKQVEPGTYEIVNQPAEGYLYLFDQDEQDPTIIQFNGQEVFDSMTQQMTNTEKSVEVELKTGQKMSIQGASQIFLEKK